MQLADGRLQQLPLRLQRTVTVDELRRLRQKIEVVVPEHQSLQDTIVATTTSNMPACTAHKIKKATVRYASNNMFSGCCCCYCYYYYYYRFTAIRYDTIRDAILTCARKPTWVDLIYRMETTTKIVKTEKKLKSKNRYVRTVTVKVWGIM